MKNYRIAGIVIAVFFLFSNRVTVQEAKFQPTWQSLDHYQIPSWFRDAKFGIFIRSGVYSVPAFESEWYSGLMYLKDSKVYKHHV